MSYTITNNVMYIRNEVGELVPVSMIASGADQTIQAIKDTATAAESQIDIKVTDANTAIEAKTDEQVARIPEVITLAEDVSALKDEKLDKMPSTWPEWTADEQAQARASIAALAAADYAPIDKTDSMTQPIGKDADGKLWTAPTEQSDWNENDETSPAFVKNRPFYTGEPVFTEIIPEQTYTLSSTGRFTVYVDESGTYQYSLEVGKEYTVVYNGTTYELTSGNAEGIGTVGDINPLFTGSEPTMPFAIAAGMGHLQIIDYTGNTEVTFKISGFKTEIKKIDTKYIPELPEYMSKTDPVGYGSFSLNRKADTTIGANSHAEGDGTTASGAASHAEGFMTIASELTSHAEGFYTEANARFSHAEGYDTKASGDSSHAEGHNTKASGDSSHAEGSSTVASGVYSHAEGYNTTASGKSAHSEGFYTMASSDYQHVQGKYNIEDSAGVYVHIVGNGTDSKRRNCHTLDWNGNAWFAGTLESSSIIIPSSTANSTKKFRITVDDSGTISATEVT